MSLRVFDSLTRKKEDFAPLTPGEVRIYVCGVTVYDLCHIGHARSAIVFFDCSSNSCALKRTLERNFSPQCSSIASGE